MKKTVKCIALLAVMGMVATGCQKENMVEFQNGTVEEVTSITVYYTIDGVTSQATFADTASWNEFLADLFALAKKGHRVSFRNTNQQLNQTKETVVYVTKDEAAAHSWANTMMNNGYQVTIEYDKTTEAYTCTAVR